MSVRGIALAAVALGSLLAACAGTGGWDVGRLEARHPGLAAVDGHRLADATPYFAPGKGGLALLLCRWSTAAPVPVWLPPYASDAEILAIERSLAAWEGAGLGVRFVVDTWEDQPPRAGIVFEILDTRSGGPRGAADTIADCSVPTASSVGPASETPVDAELQYASIHLRRGLRNAVGQEVPLTETELLGAVVHELGHALGFPDHIARPGHLMSAHGQVDAARRWGRRIQDGEVLNSPTLQGLYAVPSGARVGWLPLEPGQRQVIETVSRLATNSALRGPWVRVDGVSARMLWRHATGQPVSVVVLEWGEALRDPTKFVARLNRLARLLVEQGDS